MYIVLLIIYIVYTYYVCIDGVQEWLDDDFRQIPGL